MAPRRGRSVLLRHRGQPRQHAPAQSRPSGSRHQSPPGRSRDGREEKARQYVRITASRARRACTEQSKLTAARNTSVMPVTAKAPTTSRGSTPPSNSIRLRSATPPAPAGQGCQAGHQLAEHDFAVAQVGGEEIIERLSLFLLSIARRQKPGSAGAPPGLARRERRRRTTRQTSPAR